MAIGEVGGFGESAVKRNGMEKVLKQDVAELSAIFDSAPIVMLIVDSEYRVVRVNHAAGSFVGHPAESMIGLIGGAAMHCAHSLDDPKGCGFGPACQTCVVRRTVLDTFSTGKNHYQVEAELLVYGTEKQEKLNILVSTVLLNATEDPLALVCFEDITELKRVEEKLRRNRDRYARAEAIANLGHFERVYTEDEAIWSEGNYRIYGVNPDESIPTWENILKLIHPSDRSAVMRGIEVTRSVSGKADVEYRIIRPDGSERILHSIGDVTYDEDGKPQKIFGVTQDITERKQAEEVLRKSERKYRSLFKNMLSGFAYCQILVDEDNKPIDFVYLEVNDAFERLTGLKRADIIGKKVTEAIPGIKKSHPELFSIYGKVALTGKGTNFEVYFEPLAIWLTISVYSPQKGYFVALFENITERKQVEEALETAEENFRNSIAGSPLGIIILNKKTEILYTNKAILDMYGFSSLEELKTTLKKDRYLVGTLVEVEERMRRRRLGKPNPNSFEVSIKRKDGEVRHLEVSHDEVIWDGEKRFQLIYKDITERKKIQEALENAKENCSNYEMTAGIAHEVNNPLGSILLYSELLMSGDASLQIRKDLKIIHDEAKRAARIITDLLTYSRRTKTQMSRLDLHEILNKVRDMRRYEESVRNISLSTNFSEGPLYVQADLSQMIQVFMNLVLNAEAAIEEANNSKGGHITINTQKGRKWARVSIVDDGPGIPEEILSQVFYPFFTTKGVGEGTGLGLSICYGIITSHKGLVSVKNNKKGGATFTVELPLAEVREEETHFVEKEG